MKKVTWFFPLHLDSFYGQYYEKQKSLDQVIIRFKLQNKFKNIPFLFSSFESGICGKKRKETTKHGISQERKELFRRKKNHFS